MYFSKHKELEGKHAILSPSNYHWVNYDDAKMTATYTKHCAAIKGTRLHELAKQCIELGVTLPRNKKTLNRYVNDAIGYRLRPEQPLYYSDNCFGTADAIGFRDDILRIHDLKTGSFKSSMTQLRIYAALFCLEYRVDPFQLKEVELRIYQSDDILVDHPKPETISELMEKIVHFDELIDNIALGG